MFKSRISEVLNNPVQSKLLSLSVVLFFVFIGDAVLSFWVPNLVQDTFGSSQKMGLIMSFSSIAGLLADLTLPQILINTSVKKLLLWGGVLAIVFPTMLFLGTKNPAIFVFLIAMAVWGIYYELIGFSIKRFVADTVPMESRSSSWAIIDVFRSLAYFLGPLIAGWVIIQNSILPVPVAISFVVIGIILLMFFGKPHESPSVISLKEINIFKEVSHWTVLFEHVWPMVILTLFMGLIDATFWTVGAVWTETLAKQSFLGSFFLPAYMLPSLFMGFVVAKWKIFEGKKKIAERFMLVSGIFLACLALFDNVFWQILMVFASSVALSVTYPMTDAVYSDIVSRMGRERNHLIGLSNSSVSLSYIVGPAIAGLIAGVFGARMTFAVMGGITILIALVLLLTTPKKLRLPETEIKNWE
jgi:MFS family permease